MDLGLTNYLQQRVKSHRLGSSVEGEEHACCRFRDRHPSGGLAPTDAISIDISRSMDEVYAVLPASVVVPCLVEKADRVGAARCAFLIFVAVVMGM